jgi:hypothetical protein
MKGIEEGIETHLINLHRPSSIPLLSALPAPSPALRDEGREEGVSC